MCTSILLKSKSGAYYWGRTMDFAPSFFNTNHSQADIPSEIVNIPVGYEIDSQLKNWHAKYNTMGTGAAGTTYFYDGINECGLVGDMQVLMETTHASLESLKARNLTPVLGEEFVTYILTQCKDVDEVKQLASKLGLLDQAITYQGQKFMLKMHYTFADKTGKAVVLEPTDNGAFKIYDSIGVMTNSPEYGYHLTNIRNYISLSDLNIPTPQQVGNKLQLNPIEGGTGYGLLGLPGDYTSPSRFVRSIFIANNIDEFSDDEAIATLYNTFKPVMIPKGIDRFPNSPKTSDFTQYWAGYDINERSLYLQIPTCLMMTKFVLDDSLKEIKRMKINPNRKTNNPI